MTSNRLPQTPPSLPPHVDGGERAPGPAAGLCATCVHGVVTVLRCGGSEPWQEGSLTSVAACHSPLCVLRHVHAKVESCDGYARRTERR